MGRAVKPPRGRWGGRAGMPTWPGLSTTRPPSPSGESGVVALLAMVVVVLLPPMPVPMPLLMKTRPPPSEVKSAPSTALPLLLLPTADVLLLRVMAAMALLLPTIIGPNPSEGPTTASLNCMAGCSAACGNIQGHIDQSRA